MVLVVKLFYFITFPHKNMGGGLNDVVIEKLEHCVII